MQCMLVLTDITVYRAWYCRAILSGLFKLSLLRQCCRPKSAIADVNMTTEEIKGAELENGTDPKAEQGVNGSVSIGASSPGIMDDLNQGSGSGG